MRPLWLDRRLLPPGRARNTALLCGALLVWTLMACGGPEVELLAVPEPELASLTEAAQAQLRAQRASLDRAIEDPQLDAAELAEVFGETGRHYHAYELASAADPCYRNAEALAPEAFAWPYLLGHLHRSASEHEAAVRSFRRALEIDPEHRPARVWLADTLVDLDRLDEAEAEAESVLARDANAAPALIVLARVTAAREDHARTVELLERARGLAPEASEVNYPLGLAYRGLGDLEAAERFLAQQGRVKARFADPWLDGLQELIISAGAALNRGALALGQGELALAEQEFRKAAELDPENPSALTNLAFTLVQQGDGAGALAALEQALDLDPDNAKANFNMASLLVRLGRSAEADAHFEAALAADPNYVDAHFNHANNLVRLGQIERAAEHYARVLDLDPANGSALLMHGVLLLRLDRWTEGIETLETAHAARPDDALLSNSLARALATAPQPELRDPQRALSMAEALVSGERSVTHVEALAMALAAAGRFEEAADRQSDALWAAREAGRSDLVTSLEQNLLRYEAGQEAVGPWTEQDPNMPGVR